MMQNADHIFLQSNQFIGEVPWALCLLRAEKSLTLLWADCRGVNPRVKCSVKCCTTCFSGESSSSLSNGGGNVDGDSESPPGEDAPLSESDSDGKILAVLKKMAPDGGATLENSLTPQYKAYSWLVETGYEWVSDILTLQRYALATLYFA